MGIKTIIKIKTGLLESCDNCIFIKQDNFERNWDVLKTKAGGSMASVIFSFKTEHRAMQAGRQIAQAIGGRFYGKTDPGK